MSTVTVRFEGENRGAVRAADGTRRAIGGIDDQASRTKPNLRPLCRSCPAGYPPCPHVRRAIEAVLEWLESRELLSRAEWLRAERIRPYSEAA